MNSGKDFAFQVFKSSVITVITALLLVLLFAFLINVFSFSDAVIKPINCVIKIIAVFVGVILSVRGEKGFIKGGIAGVISLLIAYLVFALLGGGFSSGITVVWEILLGFVIGGATGAISVNLKK